MKTMYLTFHSVFLEHIFPAWSLPSVFGIDQERHTGGIHRNVVVLLPPKT